MAIENNIKDPSTEGVGGLKGLKGVNQTPLTPERLEFLNRLPENIRGTLMAPPTTPGQYTLKLNQDIMSTPMVNYVGGEGVGDSTYDYDITMESQLRNLPQSRGELQPWYAQIGAGVGKMGVLAGTTFAQSTLGLVAGGLNALVELDGTKLWDNEFAHAMNDINKWSEEAMPNYYTEGELNSPWYSNLGTANFIGDKFLKNMGFTIGAIGAGALTGGASSAALSSVKGGKFIAQTLGTITSAAGEATIEAVNSADDYTELNSNLINQNTEKKTQDLIEKYSVQYKALQDKYAKGDILVRTSEIEGSPLTSQKYLETQALEESFNQEMKSIEDEKEKLMSRLDRNRERVGNAVFGANMVLLSATNSIQFGRQLAGGFSNSKRASNLIARNKTTGQVLESTEDIAKALSKKELEYVAREGKRGSIIKKSLTNMVSEGFEEGSQNVASNTAQIRYSADLNSFAGAKINPHVQDEVNGWYSSALQTLDELFGTPESEGWEEVFLGGLTGLVGVPIFKKGKNGIRPTWAGGIKEAIDETNHEYSSNDVVGEINNLIQSPEFLNRYLGLIRHNHYQDLMDKALEDGNEFEFENNETSQLISDVLMFRDANAIEEYKQFVESFSQVDDKQLDEIKKATIIEGTDKNIYEGMSDKAIKELIETNAKKTLERIDKIVNIHDSHLVKLGDKLEKDGLQELTWMRMKIDDWNERSEKSFDKLKELMSPVIDAIQDKVLDEKGNQIDLRALLNTNYRQFVNELTNEKSKLREVIVNALDLNQERLDKALALIDKLEKEKKSITGNTKEDILKSSKLSQRLTNLYNQVGRARSSGLMLNAEEVNSTLKDIFDTTTALDLFTLKYVSAINKPESINKTIQEEQEKSAETTDKIENNKLYNKIKDVTNLQDLKKGLMNTSISERNKLLKKLSKENTTLGKLAKDLKEIEDTTNQIINLLDTDEFDDISEEDKISLLNEINDVIINASNYGNLIDLLKEKKSPVIDRLVDTLQDSKEELEDYEDNSKKPTTPNKPQSSAMELFNLNIFGTSTATDTNKTTQSNDSKEDSKPVINTESINYEDLFKALEVTDEDIEGMSQEDLAKATQEAKDRYSQVILENSGQKIDNPIEIDKKERKYWENKYKEINGVPNISESSTKDDSTISKEINKELDDINNNVQLNQSFQEKLLSNDGVTEGVIDAAKDKLFIPFSDAYPDYKVIWDYLNNNGAFDFVNSGKLSDIIEKNPEALIRFIVDKKLNSTDINGNKPLSNTVLLGIEIDGNMLILGVLKTPQNSSSNLNQLIIEESRNSKEDRFISDKYSTVNSINTGRIITSTKDKSSQDEDVRFEGITLGVAYGNGILYTPTLSDDLKITPANIDNKGRVYMMVKSGNGKYLPTPVIIKRFNDIEYSEEIYGNTPIYKYIKEAINIIADPSTSLVDKLKARDLIEKYLHFPKDDFRLHWANADKTFVYLSKIEYGEEGEISYNVMRDSEGKEITINLTDDINQNTENILSLLKNLSPRMQVESRFLNDSNYIGELVESGIMTTNLIRPTVTNANFSINPVGEDGKPIKTKPEKVVPKPSVTSQEKYTEIKSAKGNKYRVYEDGRILNEDGTTIDNPTTYKLVYAQHQIISNNSLKGQETPLGRMFELTLKGEKFAVITNGMNMITKIFEGSKYEKLLKDISSKILDESKKEANKAKLDNSDFSEGLKELIEKGFTDAKHTIVPNPKGDGVSLDIVDKFTGEVIVTLSMAKEDLNTLTKFEKDMQSLSNSKNINAYIPNSNSNKIYGLLSNNGIIPSNTSNSFLLGYSIFVIETEDNRTGILSIAGEGRNSGIIYSHKESLLKEQGIEVKEYGTSPTLAITIKLGRVEKDIDGNWRIEDSPIIGFIDSSYTINKGGEILSPELIKQKSEELMTSIIRKYVTELKYRAKYPKALAESNKKSNKKSLVNSLGNNLDSKKKSDKSLDDNENSSIFVSMNRSDKLAIQKALKDKGINARTNEALDKGVKDLLGIDNATLLSLGVDEIISKINCK